MSPRLFIMLAGIMAGACMGPVDRAKAQEIGSDAASTSSFPTIGSPSSSTNAASATPPAPPPIPPPLAPLSSLFTPTTPYGGGVSQTGEALAESLQQQQSNQPYNLRAGPVQLRAEADLNTTVNDNIGISKDNRETDIIVTPTGILHGRWGVSDLNTITFNIGVGYQAYVLHSQYDDVLIAPDSEVNFNLFVGDCAINFHDAFSYQQDPTQIGQLSDQVRLSRFQNDVGISAKWDLDAIMVEADYDHSNLWVLQSFYNYLTNQSDTFAPRVTYKLNEDLSAGLSGSFSDTRYEQSFQNDNTNESLGPFVSATISNFLSLTASAGGFLTQYDQGGGNGDNSNLSSYYANIGINHQITKFLSESLTAGKQYLPGLTSNYTQEIYINYGDNWTATQQISLALNLSWQNLEDSGGTTREDSNIYGLNFNVTDALTEHLNLNFGYQFLLKDAEPSSLSYYQSQGTLGMQYNF